MTSAGDSATVSEAVGLRSPPNLNRTRPAAGRRGQVLRGRSSSCGDPLSASGHVSVVNSGVNPRAGLDSIGGRAGSLRRYGQSSREGNTMDEKDNIEIVEEFDVEVTEQGDVVMEDTVAAIDLDTGEAVIDDIVAVEAADGSGFVEETISEVDADGNQTVLADVVEEFDAQ